MPLPSWALTLLTKPLILDDKVPSTMNSRMRPQLTENGACFDVSETCSAHMTQRPGVHIADSPWIPCAFCAVGPGEEDQRGMRADVQPHSAARRSAAAAL